MIKIFLDDYRNPIDCAKYMHIRIGNKNPIYLEGIKCITKDLTIDIWCNNLEQFILNANKVDYLYNLKKNKTILIQ